MGHSGDTGSWPRTHQDSSGFWRSSILEVFRLTRMLSLYDVHDVIWLEPVMILNVWAVCKVCLSCAHRKTSGMLRQKELMEIWKHTHTKIAFLSLSDKYITYKTKGGLWGGEQKGRRGKTTHGGRSKGDSGELETWPNPNCNHNAVCFQKLVDFERSLLWLWLCYIHAITVHLRQLF